jgi:hypothetical protein
VQPVQVKPPTLHAPADDDDAKKPSKTSKGRKGKERSSRGQEEEEHRDAAAAHAAPSGLAVMYKKASKTLLGWMASKIKVSTHVQRCLPARITVCHGSFGWCQGTWHTAQVFSTRASQDWHLMTVVDSDQQNQLLSMAALRSSIPYTNTTWC